MEFPVAVPLLSLLTAAAWLWPGLARWVFVLAVVFSLYAALLAVLSRPPGAR